MNDLIYLLLDEISNLNVSNNIGIDDLIKELKAINLNLETLQELIEQFI